MKIALIFAMEIEAAPVIEKLQLKPHPLYEDPKMPFRHYAGNMKNFEILLSLNGKDARYNVDNIGTIPAALNTYVTLSRYQPQLLINAGTAGGFSYHGSKIGDVYLSEEAFRFHDRRIPLSKYEEYGVGHFPALDLSHLAQTLQLKKGVITTSDSIDFTPQDLEIMTRNKGVVKEMEAASIAWVAHLLKVPFFALKAITDFVDSHETTQTQFFRNFERAIAQLQIKTLETLDYLHEHPEIILHPVQKTS